MFCVMNRENLEIEKKAVEETSFTNSSEAKLHWGLKLAWLKRREPKEPDQL